MSYEIARITGPNWLLQIEWLEIITIWLRNIIRTFSQFLVNTNTKEIKRSPFGFQCYNRPNTKLSHFFHKTRNIFSIGFFFKLSPFNIILFMYTVEIHSLGLGLGPKLWINPVPLLLRISMCMCTPVFLKKLFITNYFIVTLFGVNLFYCYYFFQ